MGTMGTMGDYRDYGGLWRDSEQEASVHSSGTIPGPAH